MASAAARARIAAAPLPPAEAGFTTTSARRAAWRESAACLGCSPSLFFPRDEAEEAVPKAVCSRCTVRVDCLVDAILARENEGVRGGLNERERRSLGRKAKRRARQAGCSTLVALMTCLGENGVLGAGPREPLVDRDVVGG